MASESLDIYGVVNPDTIAATICNTYEVYKSARSTWEQSAKETRDYLYATDINTTGNMDNPFSNRTTVPKLMQIAQNLHANYFEHLFSNPNYINWEGGDRSAASMAKRTTIEGYVRTKSRQQNLPMVFSAMLWDWIIYGNCFARLVYVNESKDDETTGERIPGYVGPKLIRVSPHDVVFNPAASSFDRSPKILRNLYSVGDIARMADERQEEGWNREILSKIQRNREYVTENSKRINRAEMDKTQGLVADGFSDIINYYGSDLVEVLEYFGDFYDGQEKKFYKDHHIVVVDRCYMISSKPIRSWSGTSYLYHDGWAHRPDNLYGMGPLDSLVGMQYKIDKLENLRADIFDHIAHPATVEVGTVEFFGVRGAPGGRYVVEEGGEVQYLHPDTTSLQADLQIQQTMNDMELLAGSPREAMGFRTPGEKTAFEMQILDNGANRLFRHKVRQFEVNVVEKVLNDFLEMARRNLNGSDLVRTMDTTFGVEQFLQITKEDLTASGKLYARGAQSFIANANMLQNLQTIFSTPVMQFLAPHISKTKLAHVVEELLGIEEYQLVKDNVGVMEDLETQRLVQTGQQMLDEEAITDPRSAVDDQIGESEAVGQVGGIPPEQAIG